MDISLNEVCNILETELENAVKNNAGLKQLQDEIAELKTFVTQYTDDVNRIMVINMKRAYQIGFEDSRRGQKYNPDSLFD